MLHALTDYIAERRRGLTKVVAYAGSAYLIGRYVSHSLQDVREGVVQDRIARENLRRRFEQNQQDVSFTIMALLPTLGTHIIEGMDVESITQELQSQSRVSKAASAADLQIPTAPSESNLPSRLESLQHSSDADARSDNGSVSVISFSGQEDSAPPSELAASSTSWVDQFSSVHSSQPSHGSGEASDASAPEHRPNSHSPNSNVGTELSDSIITNSSAVSYGDVATGNSPSTKTYTRSKAELWKEVKMLTFTRTLTVLYSVTLLTLFTHVQLNVLGKSKYIQSVIQVAQEECERERLRDALSLSNLFWSSFADEQVDDTIPHEPIDEEVERKYLTLSWWILHVGWKDVGERVRRAVEEVFEGVSLKTKLSASHLRTLVDDVRRRVEFEVTFEGTERRTKFTSTLLPPTPETLQHVLTQGGIPPHLVASYDPLFQELVSETRQQLSSGSFERVLEVCLDRATEILSRGLERNVFGGSNSGWEDPNSALGLTQEPTVRLAGMLPGLARWCHLALEGLPNELVDGLAGTWEVSAFSAIIYSDYDDLIRS